MRLSIIDYGTVNTTVNTALERSSNGGPNWFSRRTAAIDLDANIGDPAFDLNADHTGYLARHGNIETSTVPGHIVAHILRVPRDVRGEKSEKVFRKREQTG